MKALLILALIALSLACQKDGEFKGNDCKALEINDDEVEAGKKKEDYQCCYINSVSKTLGIEGKMCKPFLKEKIQDGKIKDLIKRIEDGTEYPQAGKAEVKKLDCNSSFIKYSLFSLLLILFI